MSGVAGGNRISKSDVERTFNSYYNKVLKQIPGFRKASLSGSVKAGTKEDYGDLDIIVQFDGEDKKEVKKRIIDFIEKQSDKIIVPFKSEKYAGKKYHNAGELISVLFPIEGKEEGYIQVDNIIALDPVEHSFKGSFLDLPAEKQGLLIGLARVVFLEEPASKIFKRLKIKDVPQLGEDEEYEFNLSSSKLTLRKVKLQDFKEVNREDVWSTTDWNLVDNLFKPYKTDGTFEQLLASINKKVKNPRSKRRIAGVFKSMVTVKSGEEGTPKGDAKTAAIQKVDQLLTEIEKEGIVGLLAGGFKPPHAGHFKLAKDLSKKVDKIIIFIGSAVREGEAITPMQSKYIWEVYGKYLPVPVQVIPSYGSPISDLFKWVEDNNQSIKKAVIGTTEERAKVFHTEFEKNRSKYPNAEVLVIPFKDGASLDDKLSGRNIRTNPEYLESLEWTPMEVDDQGKKQILRILNRTISEYKQNNEMLRDIDGVVDAFLPKKEKVEEGSSGAPIDAVSATPSKDRAKMVHLYNHLRNLLYLPEWDIQFDKDRIVITKKDAARISYDYTPYMGSILEYMLDQKMNILPLPEIKLRRDVAESVDFFGKTAYYDPAKKEIILYVEGRHPKDVMRSFVHEMIHHMQNLEGRLEGIATSNTNEDDSLNEIEQEAYLKGNMTFRNWEDKIKNS